MSFSKLDSFKMYLYVLSQKAEHVIDLHGTVKVSEAMAASFVFVF